MNKKYIKVVISVSIILGSASFYYYDALLTSAAQTLPAPNHPMWFGYYHVDSQYGDFKNEIKDYTNIQIILEESWIRPPTVTNLDIQRLNEAFDESIELGHKVVYMPAKDPNNWNQSVNLAKPYWNQIEFIYLYDEPGWNKGTTEQQISNFKQLVSAAGLSQKQIAINYTSAQILNGDSHQANNLDIVGIEAYMDISQQNSANLVSDLNKQLDQLKQKTGNKKLFIVIQAYDRNGAWTNLDSLISIQTPPYLKAYNDSRVIGLFAFSYARPGGTKDTSILKQSHREIWAAINGRGSGGGSGSGSGGVPTTATPGWAGTLVFNPSNSTWLVLSNAAGDQGGTSKANYGRIMDNNGGPVSNVFRIAADQFEPLAPRAAYSKDINKYLVVWVNAIRYSGGEGILYGQLFNPDGTPDGSYFEVSRPGGSQFTSNSSSLQYDSVNKKFVLVWENRIPGINAYLITIGLNKNIGPLIKVAADGKEYRGAVLAINESKNEYCIGYSITSDTTISTIGVAAAVRPVNALSGEVGTQSILYPDSGINSIAFTDQA